MSKTSDKIQKTIMRGAIYSVSIFLVGSFLNVPNVACESVDLSRVLDEVIELKQRYHRMEESMTDKMRILEDKVKRQEIKLKQFVSDNAKQAECIRKETFQVKKLNHLKTLLHDREIRIQFLDNKIGERKNMKEMSRLKSVKINDKDENSKTLVTSKNCTRKHDQSYAESVHYSKKPSGSRAARLLATSYPTQAASNSYAFYAYMSNDMPAPSPHHTFIYDHVVTNEGGHYNHHSGIFTVPQSGVYVFSATTISHGNAVTFYEIVKNSSQFSIGLTNSVSIANYHTGTLIGVIYAEKDDIIYVRSQAPGSAGQSHGSAISQDWARTSFCGWRLS